MLRGSIVRELAHSGHKLCEKPHSESARRPVHAPGLIFVMLRDAS